MIKKQMMILINKRKNIDDEQDETVLDVWKQELEVLEVSLENTISYLQSASEEEIYWTTEIWEDLSQFFKSKKLFKVFQELKRKYPNIANDIQIAIDDSKDFD